MGKFMHVRFFFTFFFFVLLVLAGAGAPPGLPVRVLNSRNLSVRELPWPSAVPNAASAGTREF